MSEYKHFLTSFLVIILSISGIGVSARNVARKTAHKDPLANMRMGFYVEDLITGEVLVDERGDESFVPASITKAVTVASVLSSVDEDFRYRTTVSHNGHIVNGVLEGDIIIEPSGDPTLESVHFKEYSGFADSIACHIKIMGIDSIAGCIKVRAIAFDESRVPSGWLKEDLMQPYGALFHPLNFRDNRFALHYPSKQTSPEVPDLNVTYTRTKGALRVSHGVGEHSFRITGRTSKRGRSFTLVSDNPAVIMVREIEKTLAAKGIAIGNEEMSNGLSGDKTEIYSHLSAPIPEIMRSLMYRSDNLMAEGMLRLLRPDGSRSSCLEDERALWCSRGTDMANVSLYDGSGLSRNGRMTPYFLADVLVWMSSWRGGALYASLFPRVGRDGTVRSLLRDTPLEGKLALKSGSMRGVKTYAGYKLDDEGLPTHVVVIMANGFTSSAARVKQMMERRLLETFCTNIASDKYDEIYERPETSDEDEESIDGELEDYGIDLDADIITLDND